MDNQMNIGLVAGLIKALAPGVRQTAIDSAVASWLEAHPEATTTVQDGAITEEKLYSALATKINNAVAGVTSLGNDFDTINDLHLLQAEEVHDTVQSIQFDSSGNVRTITHNRNNVAIRTDVFTFGSGTINEVRTLNTGASLTIATNTETLITTVTYAAA